MRIDKYLWAIRYFKTRNQAADLCRKGQVEINGQKAKASREVYASDKIRVRKEQIYLELTVLDVPASRVSAKLVDIYRKDTTPAEALEHREVSSLVRKTHRKKGTGRPTKKDRRGMDEFMEEEPEAPE